MTHDRARVQAFGGLGGVVSNPSVISRRVARRHKSLHRGLGQHRACTLETYLPRKREENDEKTQGSMYARLVMRWADYATWIYEAFSLCKYMSTGQSRLRMGESNKIKNASEWWPLATKRVTPTMRRSRRGCLETTTPDIRWMRAKNYKTTHAFSARVDA